VARSGALEKAERLIIVPHGVLSYLPFAALVDPATNQYLAQRHVLLHLPTSAVLPMLRRVPVDAAVTRAEVFAPLPNELPATKLEANSVAESMRGAVVRLGSAASEQRFRQALEKAGVVHVASHATLNSRNPMFTAVEFARSDRGGSSNNGRLELHELLGTRSNASLVFLSGCETAVGSAWTTQFDTGEDFATLGQAFLLAGARNVVATLWRIDDVGAADFARHFYEGLSDGYADALAKAQRRMIESEKYQSPYFWAAYQISGSG
jgi:CHAT domain-containing protein